MTASVATADEKGKKMDRKALGVLAIAIIVAMVAVLFVGDGGLSRQTETLAQTELASFGQAKRTVGALSGEVRAALEAQPDFFAAGAYDEAWASDIARAEEAVASGEAAASELAGLLENDDKETEEQAKAAVARINAARVAAVAAVEPAASTARSLLAFKQDLPARLEAMQADHAAIQAADLGPITARVAAASVEWPGKADDLRTRLATLTEIPASAAERWEATSEARANADALAPEQLLALARDAETLARSRAALIGAPDRLGALIEELDRSWDKILVDMEIQEGLDVTFRHKYRKVYTPVLEEQSGMLDGAAMMAIALAGLVQEPAVPSGGGADAPAQTPPDLTIEETWETVSKAEFERMKNNLGMVVAHKPAGKYDHEAESLVQPAGFQYVAPYGERNRYGYWDGGFWRFYGQYAFMRDVFWGRGWRVGRDDWDGYRRHRDSGRTYYGTGSGANRYGSSGTSTRSRYSSSGYVKTDGYRNSNYVRSGGTYRGSRYASRSSGGSRGGGFSRSGGRSGGK